MSRSIALAPVELPEFGVPEEVPRVPAEEYDRRLDALRAAVDADWVLVYGDREHFANLAFACGFDPRFEEAFLLLGDGRRILAVGNEGLGYAALLPITLDVVLCPSLSLMGQRRSGGATPGGVLREAGVRRGQRVGVVGWKSLGADEWELGVAALAVPAFLVDALRGAVGDAALVVDVTGALIDPRDGLRTRSSADQLAAFEWGASRASACVAAVTGAARPGVREQDAVAAMPYAGEPLSAHVMFASGPDVQVGLRSPTARRLELGDAATTAIGFWGGLCCRAGLVAHGPDDLGAASAGYLERLAIPYWGAIVGWYETLGLGVTGAALHDAVSRALEGAEFEPSLNPGHLVHLDEWVHSPVRPGSDEPVVSGMTLACDIIPTGARAGWAANCEDPVAVADESLRRSLAERHPEAWRRIEARRRFMRETLGIDIAAEVLPLSNMPALFRPFWLAPATALVHA